MSKVILSYSLFDQTDKKFDRSGHDPFNKNANRYWMNLPFISIVNKLCFPDSETYLYVPSDLKNNPMFFFLEQLNDAKFINLQIVNKPHTGTEPTIWRMAALWEKTDFCFCRDMDSILSPTEVKSMLHFINTNNYWIHNIRSVKQHNVEGTSIMAGLCGFNAPLLKEHLPLPNSFEQYEKFYKQLSKKRFFLDWRKDLQHIANKDGQWGCDQETLINFFIKTRNQATINKILDTYSQPPSNRVAPGFKGRVKRNDYYKLTSVDISTLSNTHMTGIDKNILTIMDKFIVWSGQPVNTSGGALKSLLSLPLPDIKKMNDILQKNNKLKIFYKI